jgi:uncharacterized circularly permuted ATP-grasp superfamily protein/uncharacterized alpha-E superfamily protein
MDIVKRQEILDAYRNLPAGDLTLLARKTHIDPLPYVVKTEDVPFLEAAVAEWGELLSAVYHDLWGPQELLRSGVLDPALLWGALKFDPAFSQTLPRHVAPLCLFRLDLQRTEAGWWHLLSLGTSVPSGLGPSLETRITHSRTFGSKVPHDNLIRLAPFFQGLKDLWFQASLGHKDEPAIMVWTLGPSDPKYAEPVTLARYFGYPLVESRDLTVRSGKVFLKTLGGLRPVDVLVRFVPDSAIDPLAGNPGGWGGVAGLLQAVRDGTVLVTNAPGSGLLEQPVFLPEYPRLARHLLGRELLLSTVLPTERDQPCAQEPFFDEEHWTPAPVTLRLFAARLPQGWELMPGGLALRTPGQSSQAAVRKDLWFLSTEAVAPVTLLPTGEKPSEINRAADLPSRVADDLYWLGRYTERAWVDLRFLEKWWELRFEGGPESHDAATLDKLVRTLGILPEDADEGSGAWKQSRLAETLASIHQIAGQVLDRLSLETHRLLREFVQFLTGMEGQALPETLRQLNLRLAAFSGLIMESMTRNPGWRFLDMGRRLERAELVVEAFQALEELEAEDDLTLLLDIFDSTLTYRTRYRLAPQRAPVLDLLLLDETNPRSLAFQLEALSQHVEHLPRASQRAYWTVEEKTVLDLTTRLRLADATALVAGVLEPFLADVLERLDELGDALHQSYLAKIDSVESLQARVREVP